MYKESISRILKIGCHFVYIIHEGGGNFIYSYFTIISNNCYDLSSPKIKINNKWVKNESGEQVELLVFGRVIEVLKLKEVLFLLNSRNHEVYDDFDEFRKDFIKSNEKEYYDLTLNFEGPFSDLIKKIKWNEIEDIKDFPISISTKNAKNESPYIILNRRGNDTLGKAFKNDSLEYASYC